MCSHSTQSFIQMFVLFEDSGRYCEIYEKLDIILRKIQADAEDKCIVTPLSTGLINKSIKCCGMF